MRNRKCLASSIILIMLVNIMSPLFCVYAETGFEKETHVEDIVDTVTIEEEIYERELGENTTISVTENEEINFSENIDNKDQIDTIPSENAKIEEEVYLIEGEESNTSSNSIIVQTSHIEELEKDEDVEEITEVAEGIYVIDYKNEEVAKEKTEDLLNSDYVEQVVEDSKMKALDNESRDYSESVRDSRLAWGLSATGMDHYVDYLNLKSNTKRIIRVAVLDTGINFYHEAFGDYSTGDRIDTQYSYNYVSNNRDITDDEGHGTSVASIIAQATPYNVKIVPVKVLDAEGSGYTSDILKAVSDIKDHVDIINLSLGHNPSKDTAEEKALYESILKEVYNNGKGPIVVCAAGNDGAEVHYPACSQYTMAITSVKQNSGGFSFSTFSNYGKTVDFSAPGESLIVADYAYTNAYAISSGTSLATPFACAAIALLKTEYTLNTYNDVKNKLMQYADDLGATGKDNYYGYGNINFITNRFEKPVIAKIESPSLTFSGYNVEIDVVCDDNIVQIAYPKSGQSISTWYNINNPSTCERITINVPENGTYTIYLKDTEGQTTSQTIEVKPKAIYKSHVQGIGWQDYVMDGTLSGTSGQALRLEAIQIKLGNSTSGGITYRTYIQGTGWESTWKSNNELSGTNGKSLRIEAIQIKLTGQIAKEYDVYYCVHVQGYGWLNWAKNGAVSGTTGYSKRIEGIKILLVKKGGTAPSKLGTNANASVQYTPTKNVVYMAHVQRVGWQNCVSNGATAGTTGKGLRLEAIKIKLENMSGGVQYKTHIQGIGWESSWKSNNAVSGTIGKGLRIEAIQIQLTGDAAKQYDIYYRAHVQGYGWLGWAKNGQSAGTTGYGKRLEGIQIKLVAKGGAAPGSTSNVFIKK